MVNILPVNDPPFFFTPTILLDYTETDPPSIIRLFQNSSVEIGDVDNSHLFSAYVSLESPQPLFDTIQINPPNSSKINLLIVNSTYIKLEVSCVHTCCGVYCVDNTLVYWPSIEITALVYFILLFSFRIVSTCQSLID